MKIWQLFITALLGGFSGAIMPGPLLTINIKESMRRGFWTGPKLILGHALLEMALVVTLLLGFGAVLRLAPVKGGIGLVGGLILLWMAWGMIREARSKVALESTGREKGRGLPIPVAGAVISLSNPYWILWWATVGLYFLTQAQQYAFLGVAVFFLGHITADLIWYGAISAAIAGGRRLLSDRLYRGIILVCGLFLIYLGLWFADSGLGFLGLTKPSAWLLGTWHFLWGS